MLKTILGLVLLLLTITAAYADPTRYRLEPDKSSVRFTYRLDGRQIKGAMPVASADILIDFDTLPASKIQITLNVSKARAGFIFATQALLGKSVLDVANHPHIRFVSTKVLPSGNGVKITGMVTIRGVTKPLTLMAGFYRLKDSDPADLLRLSILLTGTISRSAFGATGYPDLVGDRIDLRILARIRQGN